MYSVRLGHINIDKISSMSISKYDIVVNHYSIYTIGIYQLEVF